MMGHHKCRIFLLLWWNVFFYGLGPRTWIRKRNGTEQQCWVSLCFLTGQPCDHLLVLLLVPLPCCNRLSPPNCKPQYTPLSSNGTGNACVSSFIPSDLFALLSSVNSMADVRPPETVSHISSTLFMFSSFCSLLWAISVPGFTDSVSYCSIFC